MDALDLFDVIDLDDGSVLASDLERAEAIARRLQLGRGQRAMAIPTRYRVSNVTEEEARVIAESWFRGIAAIPGGWVDEMRLRSATRLTWTFHAPDPNSERVPGGRMCSVDRVDGHIWSDGEFHDLAELQGDEHA